MRIGSQHQPFQLFIRDVDLDEGQRIVRLLDTRYVPGEGDDHPRRSYAYVRGTLVLLRGRPEMAVSSVDQITDGFSGRPLPIDWRRPLCLGGSTAPDSMSPGQLRGDGVQTTGEAAGRDRTRPGSRSQPSPVTDS